MTVNGMNKVIYPVMVGLLLASIIGLFTNTVQTRANTEAITTVQSRQEEDRCLRIEEQKTTLQMQKDIAVILSTLKRIEKHDDR